MRHIIAVLALVLCAVPAHAEEEQFTLTVTEVVPAVEPPLDHGAITQPDLQMVPIDIGVIIQIGKALWEIIKANQPTAEMSFSAAGAIPQGIAHWNQMSGWATRPAVRTYRARIKNALGNEAVVYTYSVIAIYGGSYEGKGRYLQDVRCIAHELKVGFGYNFFARAEIPTAYNVGTPQAPLAALNLIHRFTLKGPFKHYETTQHYVVRGDGAIVPTLAR
jgi:hypothetical protein